MNLILFDLDHTLLNGDTQSEWGNYLIERNLLDPIAYRATMALFEQGYHQGNMDIHGLLEFQLSFLTKHAATDLAAWREECIQRCIQPLLVEAGKKAIAHHQEKGADIILITATNEFLTAPIAELLGIEHLVASHVERDSHGNYTGRSLGTPSYKEGKVTRLQEWLVEQRRSLNDYEESWFYSDSHNDLPLLEQVDRPIAVNPDATLLQHALAKNWDIVDFGVKRH